MIYGRIAEIALAIESLVYTPPIGDSAVRKALGALGALVVKKVTMVVKKLDNMYEVVNGRYTVTTITTINSQGKDGKDMGYIYIYGYLAIVRYQVVNKCDV